MISWQGGHEFDHLALSPDSALLPHVNLLGGHNKLTWAAYTADIYYPQFWSLCPQCWRVKLLVSSSCEDSNAIMGPHPQDLT